MRSSAKNVGRYRILERVGSGGMALVYKAHDPLLNRVVAVKLYSLEKNTERINSSSFLQKLRVVASLNHPAILPIYDYGETGEHLYIVTRLMQGGTLADLIATKETISSLRILKIISQIGSALDFAHQRGIIHLDVKPANILLDFNGDAFLTDFGIAEVHQAGTSIDKDFVGTPLYMSPEQAIGKSVTGQSDIYSLGVVLFELLTKRTPFQDGSPLNIVLAKGNLPAPIPSKFNSSIPAAIDAILSQALEILPEKRFGKASDLAIAFGDAIGDSKAPIN